MFYKKFSRSLLYFVILSLSLVFTTFIYSADAEPFHKIIIPLHLQGTKYFEGDVILWHDYGAFALYKVSDSTMNNLPNAIRQELTFVDDTILIDAFPFDTQDDVIDFPHNYGQTGGPSYDGEMLQLVQFVGPIKAEWLEILENAGTVPIHYVANNAYLVWADNSSRDSLNRFVAEGDFLQFSMQYQPYFKLGQSIHERFAQANSLDVNSNAYHKTRKEVFTATVQIYAHENKHKTEALLEELAIEAISNWSPILAYQNIRVMVSLEDVETLSKQADVVWIGEYFVPELFDEVQGQILAADFDANQTGPAGTGYRAWLDSLGFSSDPNDYPIVDVVDDGIGNGTTNSGDATMHRFGNISNSTRLAYVENCTSASSGEGIGGHGHINTSIVGGYDERGGFPFRDPNGYQRGMGISPYGQLAGTRIFGPSYNISACGGTDTGVIEATYQSGARISTNSWGCSGCAGSYDDSSQAYDVGIRDADLSANGNQEFIHIFSAGNSGSSSATIGTPGNGKNMITVGASENDRPSDEDGSWTDGCNINSTGADNAMDIIDFSSRGPAPGGRIKPEIIAPGTHIQGTASTSSNFNGTVVCDQYRPSGQTVFASSSGTSHSTPAVAGYASLIHYWFQNKFNLSPPSPAAMKAYMMAHPTYLTGLSANDDLPSNSQGYGMPNMQLAFDDTPKFIVDQSVLFDNTGETEVYHFQIADSSKPVRIALAYTDQAGNIGTSPQVNDLNLSMVINGQTYLGNQFNGQWSVVNGSADSLNNYEAIFLPTGTSGLMDITITAQNIAGDGVPNVGDSTDQDFALICYNCQLPNSGTLIGQVSDASTTNPISGGIINASSISGTVSTSTDSNGDYQLPAPENSYDVTASAFGYHDSTISSISVISGVTTTHNFILAPLPNHVINGTVLDDHTGWALYAKIIITGDPFSPPDNEIWSDPESGYYSITLPEGMSYTLEAQAWTAGYLNNSITIPNLTGNTTANITLEVDDVTCAAPGYIKQEVFYDGFESGSLGSAWSTYTTYEGRVRVSSDYPYSGNYSVLLDDYYDSNDYSHAGLILTQDLSSYSELYLTFWWREFGDENHFDDGVFISTNNGVNWYQIFSFNDGTSNYEQEIIDLVAAAQGHGLSLTNNFQIKFQFYDNYSISTDGYAIDEVVLTRNTCAIPSGGLVVGNVYSDTIGGIPLVGSTIINGNSTEIVTTQYTSDDPNVDDGFYTIFAENGDSLTARKQTFGSVTHIPTIPNGQTVRQDFALPPPQLYQVSGQVTDVNTNWELYAKVTVTGDIFTPSNNDTWTDPLTGIYTFTLPESVTYTFEAEAWADGYEVNHTVITALPGDATANISLNNDTNNCEAPGYTEDISYGEDFETNSGSYSDVGSPGEWEWGVPTAWPNDCASGSKCWGIDLNGAYEDYAHEDLRSPLIDLSSVPNGTPLTVKWQQAWWIESSRYDQAYAMVSVNGGAWQTMWQHSGGTTTVDWTMMTYDISAAAGGTVQFRWGLDTDSSVTYDGYYIDDVRIVKCSSPASGGLIIGHVYSGTLTGPTVSDATITNNDTNQTTISFDTPDDPNIADGFYTMFAESPTLGLTAWKAGFGRDTQVPSIIDGTVIQQDFALPAPQQYVISGIVTDANMGYPLYAQITVDNQTIWNDPVTGYYSFTLIEGLDYTLVAEAWLDGYESNSVTVVNLLNDETANITLSADLVACEAPGYEKYIFYDGFEAGTLDTNYWSTTTANEGRVRIASGYAYDGSYSALLDNNYNGNITSYASIILTLDLSAYSQLTLDFWWHDFGDEDSNDDGVFISDDDGQTWYNAYTFSGTWNDYQHAIIDLDDVAQANGIVFNNNFKIKFQFYDNYPIPTDGYTIDEIRLAIPCTPPTSGGLIVGNVYEFGTNMPINESTISDDNGQSTLSVSVPNSNNDGFYTLFSPDGMHTFTATRRYYSSDIQNVNIRNGDTIRQDFSLMLLPDLMITKTVKPDIALPNAPLTYSLTFANMGLITATDVIITDIVPISVTNVNAWGTGMIITPSSNYVWQVQNMPPTSSGIITITGLLSLSLLHGDRFTNTATINTSLLDYDMSSNESSVGIDIGGNIYVKYNATGADDGSTWQDAYTDLQTAITEATMKDTIMVAQGTYLPGSNRTDTFQLKDGVDIYGGFAGTHGTEGDFDVRDWQTYITILSGDIGVPNYTDDNTYHVVTGNNTNDTILDGFTISDGYANGSSWDDKVGAGMFNKDGHPTVRNIIFTDNYAYYNGGGMANTNGSMPTIENVIFSDNSTTQYNGGGLYNHYSHPTLKYITFQNNTASSGGGLYNYYSNPQFSHVTFYGNSAVSGGAIYNYVSQPTFSHMVLSGNTANVGGGIYNNNGKITLYQSALSSNSATSNGDDIYDVNGHIMLDNTILWGNITPVYTSVNSVITSNNTIIQSGQFGGTDTDPLFIDSDGEDNVLGTPDDNLRLSDKSPAIDMGDTASLPADFADIDNDNNQTEQVPFDLDNNPRISGDFVDVGAYEFQWIYYPDFIITKTVTPQSNIIYHDMVTYTIILENIGEADATSMSLTDTLALETDFAYWLESPIGTTIVNDKISWHGALSQATSITFTFVVSHVGGYNDTVTNTVYYSHAVQAGYDSVQFNVEKNYVPIATSQVFTTIEDIAISNMLTASDLRNDPLTYTVITSGTKGTVHISPTVGMFNYTPFTDSYGTDNFAYHAYDGELTSNLAIITITITPANDEPIAHGGHVTTYEETAVDGRLLATDVESDTLSYILFSLPLKGQVTISDTDTGTFIYTPITNAVGSDMFTFKVADEKSSSNIAVISITIIATNDMPIAFANQFATVEDMPLLGELIATDVDGDVLSYTIVSSTSKGTLHITDTTSGQFSYMPNQDENGADSFTFNVMDGQLESNTAMVSLTITATNDAPLASDAHVGTHRNVAFTGTLLALDVDNETLTYTLMTSATKGTVKLTDMHAGIYDYVPDEDVYGHDQFTFMVHDGWLNSNIATISVTITLSNSIPIAEDLNLTTYEDMPLLGILQATDVENDPLTYTIITPPMHGTLVMTDTHVGIFRYMPNANVHGFDYFTYQAYDIVGGNIAVVSITITATNDMPQALSADASIVEDIAYDGIMSATDIDHDVLTYTVLTYPTKGTLYHSDIYTGAFQYVPAENINGMDSFSFRVHDGEVESNIALISMTITAVNDAPVAITDTATISKNTAIDLHVLQNDSDADDDTLQIQDATTSLNGTVVIINTHIISYTPNNDFVGKDSFSYTVSDGQLSDEGQVNIIVIDNVTPTPNPTVPPTMTPTMAITLTATNTPTPTMTATATPHMDMTATATPHMDMTATATPHMDMTATITPKPSATPMLMGVLQVEPQNFMIIATEGDTNTYTHNFSIDYQGEVVPQWTATSNVNWLILDNTTGTGRKVIEAKARVQNLAVGIHHAKITIEAASMLHSPYIIDVWLVVNSISGTPLPEPVSQTIPPEGGTLSLPDGCATVEFPSDAVSDNTVVTLLHEIPYDIDGLAHVDCFFHLTARQFGSAVFEFEKPIRITTHYQLTNSVNADTVSLYWWNEQIGVGSNSLSWSKEGITTIERDANYLISEVNHLTLFAVLGDEFTQPTTFTIYLPIILKN